jgi:uncharacterized membrane protein
MRSSAFSLCFSAALLLAFAGPVGAATITVLDTPGLSAFGTAISSDGKTVVGSYTDAASSQSFRWTAADGGQDLGTLPGGVPFGVATGVSADGNKVVGVADAGGKSEAYQWTPVGGMQGLGFLSGGGTYSEAAGISANGTVIVGSSDYAPDYGSTGALQAFKSTAGGMQGLGFLAGGDYSRATAVSADGSTVVGFGNRFGGAYEGVKWTASGAQGLGLGSFAYGVSSDGSFVVGTAGGTAAMWTNSGLLSLGSLSGGGPLSGSTATGVADDGSMAVGYYYGSIVGTSSWSSLVHAFLWTSTDGIQDFSGYLTAQGADLSDWALLESVNAVSGDGRYLTGYGFTTAGTEAAFRVDLQATSVPDSGTSLGLLAISVAGLLVFHATRTSRRFTLSPAKSSPSA